MLTHLSLILYVEEVSLNYQITVAQLFKLLPHTLNTSAYIRPESRKVLLFDIIFISTVKNTGGVAALCHAGLKRI